MLFNTGEQDALQQRMWQSFCYYVGGKFLVIGVLRAGICDGNAVGVSNSIMKLVAYLQHLTENV
jgi:hypothetical protein